MNVAEAEAVTINLEWAEPYACVIARLVAPCSRELRVDLICTKGHSKRALWGIPGAVCATPAGPAPRGTRDR
jgi:hypothetical protein